MRALLLIPLTFGLASAKVNWKPLFNGKTLEPEWYISGDKNYWSIEDSSIVGKSAVTNPAYSMVFTNQKDFDQFTIKYSYRLKAGCSGFFFRSKAINTNEQVEGCQVEAKFITGQREVGSLYVHPRPGWVVQHTDEYSRLIARANEQFQDVVVTVKRPYIYVNVNGHQAVGETDPAEIAKGAKRAWDYTGNALVTNPGAFGLQIHGGQRAMDIAFKNIAILEGCGDATKPGYDGANVPGLAKQPAVFQENGTCTTSGVVEAAKPTLAGHIGNLADRGLEKALRISFPGPHTLELVSLAGKVVFEGTAPAAHEYRLTSPMEAGIYVARIKTKSGTASRKFLVK